MSVVAKSSKPDTFLPIRTATGAALLAAGTVLGALAVAFASNAGRSSLPPGPAADRGAHRSDDGVRRPGSGSLEAGRSGGAPSPREGAAAAPALSGAPSEGYAAILRGVMPAVVNISSLQVVQAYESSPLAMDPFFRQFFGDGFGEFVVPRERRALSLGSGVVVDGHGTILTNYHVVENAREVKVSLMDGRELRARPVGFDSRTDLAVLRVDDPGLPSLVMGDSERLEVGDIVLAIGNPFGLGQTVTMGIVSAIGRGSLGLADYEDFIQTDAAINPGNSGGALINTRGELVGINTAILSRSGGYQGIGFAIPANMVRDVLDSILKTGRVVRGYVGIEAQAVTPEIARAFGLSDTHGALLSGVDPQGPAAQAGLRRGDVVLLLRDRVILSDDDLRLQMSHLKPGDRAPLTILRDGRRLQIEVVLGEPVTPVPSRPGRRRG